MRGMGVGRQMNLVVVAFVVVAIAAVGGVSLVSSRAASQTERERLAAAKNTATLFELIDTVSKAQANTQKMVREKDADELEKLVEQRKALDEAAGRAVRTTGDSRIADAHRKLSAANEQVVSGLMLGDYAGAQTTLIDLANPAFEGLLSAVQALQAAEAQKLESTHAALQASAGRTRTLVFAVSFTLLGALAVFAWMLVRRIRVSLETSVTELSAGADQLNSAATQVATASQALAQGSTEQSATLEDTASAGNEIMSRSRQSSEHAREAAGLMKQAAGSIADANKRLGQMVGAMNDINASSEKISRIIRVIDEIAFQTNLLALNAAVEAARAGEAGMGFGVVADEVRALAQRCAQAARDTSSLIEESVHKSTEGKQRVAEVVQAIQGITERAQAAQKLIDDVSTFSEQQARSVEGVANSLGQMREVTQRTAATAEESAAAGEELSAQSEALRGVVSRLSLLVGARD